jgi:LAS superfamily LD-carboxypeptidase LdcB
MLHTPLRCLALAMITTLAAPVVAPRAARADAPATADASNDELGERSQVVGYRRGKAFSLEVVLVGHTPVSVPTARAFLAMQAAAREDGIDLYVYSGFRTNERQAELRQAYLDGHGNKAARPGYSNHQAGTALDLYLDAPETFAWLEANARRFGFKRTVAKEPWHWEHQAPKARKARR